LLALALVQAVPIQAAPGVQCPYALIPIIYWILKFIEVWNEGSQDGPLGLR
jgi:hypothetical protein